MAMMASLKRTNIAKNTKYLLYGVDSQLGITGTEEKIIVFGTGNYNSRQK